MKKLFSRILYISLLAHLMFLATSVFAVTIVLPVDGGQEDIYITGPTQIQSDESTLFETIQIVNKYTWFALGFVLLVVMVVAGANIIMFGGDGEKVKKNAKIVGYSMIGLATCILSYVIVRLVVNIL